MLQRSEQIAAVVAEQGFDLLEAPIRRVTTANVAIPYVPNAEAHVLPDQSRIEAAVATCALGAQGGELTCASRSPCPTSG